MPKRGHKTVGFSSKVVSLTTRLDKKTHARNYSTDPLPCTVSFANFTAPTAAHGVRDATHDRTGDDVELVTLDGKGGQRADAATVDADAR